MSKEQIQAKIEQVEKGEKALAEEKAGLQSELAALAKPELRVGGFGYFRDQLSPTDKVGFMIYGFDGPDVLLRQDGRTGCDRMGKEYFRQHVIVFFGNIFDDLAALVGPLEECRVHGVSIELVSDGYICLGGTLMFPPHTHDELCLKIRAIAATAKRKAAKNV